MLLKQVISVILLQLKDIKYFFVENIQKFPQIISQLRRNNRFKVVMSIYTVIGICAEVSMLTS